MTRDPDDERIRAALEDLNRLIAERVQREQRRDQLTGLPNELALDECLERHIEGGRDIWAAFVEVNRFFGDVDEPGRQRAEVRHRAPDLHHREMLQHLSTDD